MWNGSVEVIWDRIWRLKSQNNLWTICVKCPIPIESYTLKLWSSNEYADQKLKYIYMSVLSQSLELRAQTIRFYSFLQTISIKMLIYNFLNKFLLCHNFCIIIQYCSKSLKLRTPPFWIIIIIIIFPFAGTNEEDT